MRLEIMKMKMHQLIKRQKICPGKRTSVNIIHKKKQRKQRKSKEMKNESNLGSYSGDSLNQNHNSEVHRQHPSKYVKRASLESSGLTHGSLEYIFRYDIWKKHIKSRSKDI